MTLLPVSFLRGAFVLLALLLCMRPAFAEPVPIPGGAAPTESEASAEAHMKRGLDLRRAGDDERALAEFEQANALGPTPRARAQIGLALSALGRWREAEEALLPVVANDADPWVMDHAALLRESLATAQQHLAWLTVESNVSGAELSINGVAVGKLPVARPARVIAGIVVVEVRAPGYEPARRSVDVSPRMRARELVTLVLAAAAPPVSSAAPSASVGAVDLRANRRAVGWTTLAAGAVLLAGGVASLIVAATNEATYNDNAQCYFGTEPRDQRCGVQRGAYEVASVTGAVALSLGALAAGAGTLLVVTAAPSRRDAAGSGRLGCGLGLATVGCEGRF